MPRCSPPQASAAAPLVPSGATCSSWQTLWPTRLQRPLASGAAGKSHRSTPTSKQRRVRESALEEARRRQVQLVALDDEIFNQVPLWHPLLGMPELQAKILARARALGMLKVCKACCCASGTRAWDIYFLMDEID